MRIFAIDPGTVRCGCANSDPTETVARPLAAIEPADARAAAALVAEHGVELVVVGLPVGLGGAEGTQAALARRFRDELQALVDVPVETYDERLTTKMAQRSERSGARASLDSLAAAHLLEAYMHSRRARGRRGSAGP